ncbi:zinc-ribbon domain-containing protein [Nocardioides panacihumi]|uniref:zinc-ribbon domain-containing protein n=1 Tax=Nocardioides panacihumi TaxID=400774 RepID=UPI0031D4DCF8
MSEGRWRPARPGQSIADRMPEYAKDWDYDENGDATPETVAWRSNHRANWKCHVCGKKSVRVVGGKAYTYEKEGPTGGCRGRLCPRRPRSVLAPERSLRRHGANLVASFCLEENQPDTPDTVSYSAKRVFMWRCLKNSTHADYRLSLPSQRKTGCPLCASLACTHPDVAAEWHPTKNGDLTPFDVTHGAKTEVWWRCSRDHEWPATVANRAHASHRTRCPECQRGQTSVIEIELFAELASVLSPTLGSGSVLNQRRIPGLTKSFGHGDIIVRLGRGDTEQLVVVEYDSAFFHAGREPKDQAKSDAVLAAGHRLVRVREQPLRALHPDDIECATPTPFRMAAVVLHRMLDRGWLDPVTAAAARTYIARGKRRGTALADSILNDIEYPDYGEESFAHSHAKLAGELDQHANGRVTARNLRADQAKKVWWRCRLEDLYESAPRDRARGRGCPYCAGKKVNLRTCLATVAPHIAAELPADIAPYTIHSGSMNSVNWTCSKPSCGHSWPTTVKARTKPGGSGCPACAGKVATPWRNLTTERPDVAAIWHPTENLPLRPENVLPGARTPCRWLCPCGEAFPNTVADRSSAKHQLCPGCSRKQGWASRRRKTSA